MDAGRTATVVVEPDPGGHHFQAVAAVVSLARRHGPVHLLTSTGATSSSAFEIYLGDTVRAGDVEPSEPYGEKFPPTRTMIDVAVEHARTMEDAVDAVTLVVMDADQSLKRWWYLAPSRLRTLRRRPRVVFMLTRYPARLRPTDWVGWRLRGPKALLTVLARLTGSLDRAAGFAGREETAAGWIVKRARDPHYASAHADERDRWREELGLPLDTTLVGIFGEVSERKNAPLILEAIDAAGLDAHLVVAGNITQEVQAWIDGLEPHDRDRLHVRGGFLPNEELDMFVAAVDFVPLALTNNGPSGIMGKAAAAGVPVVTCGSTVRAREVRSTGAGRACDFTAGSIGAAMAEVVSPGFRMPPVPEPVTPEEFAAVILGVEAPDRPAVERGVDQ